jgi:murein DD-endopeptidase MepM/ murein hydrolase activator NlpD
MKRRHQRSTTLAVLTALAFLGSVLVGTPAQAMPKIAGVGLVRTDGTSLNARSGPSATNLKTGEIENGTYISIVCQVVGQEVTGSIRTSSVWNMLPNYSFVADAYISRKWYTIPVCLPGATRAGACMLPVVAPLVSGFRTGRRPGHDGIDLAAARNTPIHAAAAGTVVRVRCNTPSNNCDVDGGLGVGGCGWYVEVRHRGSIVTRYCHMVRRPSVVLGQAVRKGTVLGYVGMSGNASGPHLHFEVHSSAPASHRNAMNPLTFLASKGLAVR